MEKLEGFIHIKVLMDNSNIHNSLWMVEFNIIPQSKEELRELNPHIP